MDFYHGFWLFVIVTFVVLAIAEVWDLGLGFLWRIVCRITKISIREIRAARRLRKRMRAKKRKDAV